MLAIQLCSVAAYLFYVFITCMCVSEFLSHWSFSLFHAYKINISTIELKHNKKKIFYVKACPSDSILPAVVQEWWPPYLLRMQTMEQWSIMEPYWYASVLLGLRYHNLQWNTTSVWGLAQNLSTYRPVFVLKCCAEINVLVPCIFKIYWSLRKNDAHHWQNHCKIYAKLRLF